MAVLNGIASGQEIYFIDEVSLMSEVSGIVAYLSWDIISLTLRGLKAIWRDGYR